MTITVQHIQADGSFIPVAEVASNDLEFAWRWTQNIEGSWSRPGNPDSNERVTVLAPLPVMNGQTYGLRSSMVGDRFIVNGVAYVVSMIGFKRV